MARKPVTADTDTDQLQDVIKVGLATAIGTTDDVLQVAVDARVALGGGGGGASDATTTTKGIVKLAGDLGGTADLPTVPGLAAKAPLESPTFTGNPTAPTPTAGDDDTSLATTAFVKAQGYAPLASPALTGSPTAPTPSAGDNDTSIATTAFVATAAPDATTAVKGKVKLAGDLGGTADLPTVPGLSSKAPLASPAFTGNPTAPTPAAGDNDTSIATTAFVQNEITTIALVEDPADEGTYLIGGA